MRKPLDIGDGDPCPLDSTHGRMLVIRGSTRQHCPHVSHDGRCDLPSTRAIWPHLPYAAFVQAVAAHRGTKVAV